jgi:hypothetical protein
MSNETNAPEPSDPSTGSVDEQEASGGPCYPDDLGIWRDARGLSERCKELAERLVRQGIRSRFTETERKPCDE